MDLDDLPNLGPKSTEWLRAAGVHTLADLEELGAVDAYKRVRAMQPRASLNLLWGLAGALLGIPWNELPPDLKDRLRREAGE